MWAWSITTKFGSSCCRARQCLGPVTCPCRPLLCYQSSGLVLGHRFLQSAVACSFLPGLALSAAPEPLLMENHRLLPGLLWSEGKRGDGVGLSHKGHTATSTLVSLAPLPRNLTHFSALFNSLFLLSRLLQLKISKLNQAFCRVTPSLEE